MRVSMHGMLEVRHRVCARKGRACERGKAGSTDEETLGRCARQGNEDARGKAVLMREARQDG
jgi:hypothetical protein